MKNPATKGQRPKETPSPIADSVRASFGSWPSCLVLLALSAASAAAQYSIPWSKIAGGGGTSTGGVYRVTGTLGQHDAGPTMTNGVYALTGGYWSLLQVVQTPGAPMLTLTLTATNTAIVSWPSPSTGFVLQQATDLSMADWGAAPAPSDNGTTKFLIVDPPSGNRFYRLMKP